MYAIRSYYGTYKIVGFFQYKPRLHQQPYAQNQFDCEEPAAAVTLNHYKIAAEQEENSSRVG